MMKASVRDTILKWYKIWEIDTACDEELYSALSEFDIPEDITADTMQIKSEDGRDIGISLLYLCEATYAKYIELGIDEDIFLKTVRPIFDGFSKRGSIRCKDATWIKDIFAPRLFRLGRLQFGIGKSPCDVEERGVFKGDEVIQMHVPSDGRLDFDACRESVEWARTFFKTYFPECKAKYITGYSWLLDSSIADILGENSNILKFQTLFEIVRVNESDLIFKFVFPNHPTRAELVNVEPKNRFEREIKEQGLAGRKFYSNRGFIKL
jgi:hypothetical protein